VRSRVHKLITFLYSERYRASGTLIHLQNSYAPHSRRCTGRREAQSREHVNKDMNLALRPCRAQNVSCLFPTTAARIRSQVGLCGICLGQCGTVTCISECFSFPCQFSFHRLLHTHHLSTGAGTVGQMGPTCQVGSVSPPPQEMKKTSPLLPLRYQINFYART
jgi:hypothetical protein